MNANFIIYDGIGKIIRTGSCPASMVDVQAGDGEYVTIGSASDITQYIYNGNITNKPASTTIIDKVFCLADGIDFITLSSIPDNATILISGQGVNINQSIGNSDTITFDLAGEYNISIKSFPSLDYEVIINAT